MIRTGAILILTAACFHGAALRAQGPTASLDTTVMRIGEQVTLDLELPITDDASGIVWPIVRDTLSRHVEVVLDEGVDTLKAEDGRVVRLVRRMHLTSFDTGYWAIPPFRFTIRGAQAETSPLLLEVRSVALDSAGTLRDIKDIIEPPFSLVFWLEQQAPWIAGGLVLLGLVLYLVKRRNSKPVEASPAMTAAPELPLHQRTLAALRELEAQRLWQQGDHKAYQSRLTDLLRAYIEDRYGVSALECTTDELLQALRVSPLDRDQQAQLGNLLRLADLVKFAKGTPTATENERCMAEAIRFVERTADHRTASPHVPVPSTPERHAHGS